MAIKVGDVMPNNTMGFCFNVTGHQPGRIVTFSFATEQEAETARDAIVKALDRAVEMHVH